MANWQASGLHCSGERHVGLQANFSFAEVREDEIADLLRAVAREGCDAVAIVCTNMRDARPCRAARAGARHPRLRFGRDDTLEEPRRRGRSALAHQGMGPPVSGRSAEASAGGRDSVCLIPDSQL
jgi:hypothetical protein